MKKRILYFVSLLSFVSAACGGGSPGAAGQNGTNGTAGATGPTGEAGSDGTNGATGPTGPAGTNGATGATGATGAGLVAPANLSAAVPADASLVSTNTAVPTSAAPSDGFAGPGILGASSAVSSGVIGDHSGASAGAGTISAGVYGRNSGKASSPGYHYGVIGMSTADNGAGVLAETGSATAGAGLYALSWTAGAPAIRARNFSNQASGKVVDVDAGSGVGIYASVVSGGYAAIRGYAANTNASIAVDATGASGATALRARGDVDLGTGTQTRVKLPIYQLSNSSNPGENAVAIGCSNSSDIVLGGGCTVANGTLVSTFPIGSTGWQCVSTSGVSVSVSVLAICLRSYN